MNSKPTALCVLRYFGRVGTFPPVYQVIKPILRPDGTVVVQSDGTVAYTKITCGEQGAGGWGRYPMPVIRANLGGRILGHDEAFRLFWRAGDLLHLDGEPDPFWYVEVRTNEYAAPVMDVLALHEEMNRLPVETRQERIAAYRKRHLVF